MEDRQVIEWDKDDIDALKFMKVDVLGLGMLGCMRRAFDLLRQHKGIDLDLATIPAEDPATYAMIRKADTLGVFQIESRAQMSMLPRLKPQTLLRSRHRGRDRPARPDPGRHGASLICAAAKARKPVVFPKPELEKVLGKTLGVPLFQEQAMQVAIVAPASRPAEADQLRRAMATFKFTGGVNKFQDKLIDGMIDNGYDHEFAERTFSQLEGFGSYGFPESHAASFALIAYASTWMKCHHPDVFCAALLNAQPMGFYDAAQIVRDASDAWRRDPADRCEQSSWDCTLEPADGKYHAVRLGLRMTRGLPEKDGNVSCCGARCAALSEHPRARAAHGARDRRAGATGEGGRLCLVGAFTPGGVVGDQRAARRRAAALRCGGTARAEIVPEQIEEDVSLPADDPRARGRRRLSLAWSVAAPPSARFPAGASSLPVNISPCAALRDSERRLAHYGLGPCHGAAAARLRQGRDVHHA